MSERSYINTASIDQSEWLMSEKINTQLVDPFLLLLDVYLYSEIK